MASSLAEALPIERLPGRRAVRTADRRAAVVVALASLATLVARGDFGDWPYFRLMASDMFGSEGARIYEFHPSLQTGPVTLVVVRLLSVAGGVQVRHVCFALLGACTLWLLHLARPNLSEHGTSREPAFVAGAFVLMLWWGYLRAFGHIDDALVITLAAAALLLITRHRPLWAGVLIGVSFAVKPWAIFLLPLTLLRHERGSRRFTPPLISALVGLVLWAPVLIAAPGTIRSLRPPQALAPDSVLRLFGYDSSQLPTALRVAQLCIAVAAVALAVWRGRLAGAVLVGSAVRLALDPATWNYYTTTFVFGAFVWDLADAELVPWATLAASILVVPDWVIASDTLRASLRLVACVGALVLVIRRRGLTRRTFSGPVRSEVRSRPTSDRVASG